MTDADVFVQWLAECRVCGQVHDSMPTSPRDGHHYRSRATVLGLGQIGKVRSALAAFQSRVLDA